MSKYTTIEQAPFTVGQKLWYVDGVGKSNWKIKPTEVKSVYLGTVQQVVNGETVAVREVSIECSVITRGYYGAERKSKKKFFDHQFGQFHDSEEAAVVYAYEQRIKVLQKARNEKKKAFDEELVKMDEGIEKLRQSMMQFKSDKKVVSKAAA